MISNWPFVILDDKKKKKKKKKKISVSQLIYFVKMSWHEKSHFSKIK